MVKYFPPIFNVIHSEFLFNWLWVLLEYIKFSPFETYKMSSSLWKKIVQYFNHFVDKQNGTVRAYCSEKKNFIRYRQQLIHKSFWSCWIRISSQNCKIQNDRLKISKFVIMIQIGHFDLIRIQRSKKFLCTIKIEVFYAKIRYSLLSQYTEER